MTHAPPPQDIIRRAFDAALASPCQKSRRGAVAFWATREAQPAEDRGRPGGGDGYVQATQAFANEPFEGTCTGGAGCRAYCAISCHHAEARLASSYGTTLAGADVVHVKLGPDGILLMPSGPPSCADCAKQLHLARVEAVWLFHTTGWKRYPIVDFVRASIAHAINEKARDDGRREIFRELNREGIIT